MKLQPELKLNFLTLKTLFELEDLWATLKPEFSVSLVGPVLLPRLKATIAPLLEMNM